MKISRTRSILASLVYSLVVFSLGGLPLDAQAVDYEFTPLVTAPGIAINSFRAQPATINNAGVVAYIQAVPFVFTADLLLDDGVSVTTIDLNAASGFDLVGVNPNSFINDAGAVAVDVFEGTGGPLSGKIIRINPDASVTTMATYNADGVSGDFTAVERFAMNNAGQVAAHVILNSGIRAIVLLDDSGQTVIDTEDPSIRFSFSGPAINDDGVVAYKATEPAPNGVSVFIGDGISPVQLGLPLPFGCGGTGAEPDINNNGLLAGQHPDCLVVGSGGVVTDVIVDETTSPFTSSIGRLSLNDLDQIVFDASTNNTVGLYFGDDVTNDKLIQGGDSLFGEIVANSTGNPTCCGQVIRFDGDGGFNDHGQVVFAAATVSEGNVPTSYLIRADRDTDSDGITDNADNCTEVANPGQLDSNGDGFGNLCDADLNDDCIVNPVDLGLFRSVFFTADADADFNGDGVVNPIDLGIFKTLFFQPPGPSVVPNLCSPL